METKTQAVSEANVETEKPTTFKFFSYYKEHSLAVTLWMILLVAATIETIITTLQEADLVEFISLSLNRTNFFKEAALKLVNILAVYVVRILTHFCTESIIDSLQLKITTKMRVDLAQQAFKLSSKTYADHNTNNIISRINNDPENVFLMVTYIINQIQSTIAAAIMTIYIAFINFYLGLVLLAFVVGAGLVEMYRRKRSKNMSRIIQSKDERVSSLLVEIVKSEKDVKSLNLEENLKADFERLNNNSIKDKNKRNIMNNTWWAVTDLLLRLGSTISLLIGISLYDKTIISLSALILVYTYRSYTYTLSVNMSSIYDYIMKLKLAIERINELFLDEEYQVEHFGSRHLKNVKGRIEFKNVSFSYVEYEYRNKFEHMDRKQRKHAKGKIKDAEALDPQQNPAENERDTRKIISKTKVFDNLSFVIEPNTTVAFVGKSGSGKSTILNLISKIYSVDSGKVTIDHVNVLDLDKDTLRSSITFVNQFPYIFDMSIRENLLLANKDASDEEIAQVLKDSALEEFVASLPSGIETRVGESGIKLSGGQRQRLAIARALLRKSAIILFDESTSSLDNIAQNKVKESIDNIKGKGTVVIVAHRLSTIKNVDKIFFLNDGEIVDTGTFDELYKRNKTFKKMFLAEDID